MNQSGITKDMGSQNADLTNMPCIRIAIFDMPGSSPDSESGIIQRLF